MKNKFEVGDRFKIVKDETYSGKTGVIINIDNSEYPLTLRFDSGEEITWKDDGDIVKLPPKKEITPRFLLRYEINSDPVQECGTLSEVKKLIRELVPKGGHSFVLYEIKKKTPIYVSRVESIVIKGI